VTEKTTPSSQTQTESLSDKERERLEKREKFITAVLEKITWSADGLIPTVVQDAESDLVLMVAWMNAEALRATLEKGETHFWSRSRQALWHKGETSGNIQKVVGIYVDCDADTLLVKVYAEGPACHTLEDTCFYRPLEDLLERDS
jgi:phosphoribosyl-AMP cyclohydrolase